MIRKTIKGGDFKSQMVGELVFDQVPEEGSFNPVTSDGLFKAIDEAKEDMQEKIDEVTLDPSAVALGNVHLLDEVTKFPADGCILIDSETNGPGEMSKDTLLQLTAQNALAGNVAPAFDPTKPNDAGGYAYYADEIVAYQGATYKFKVNHSSGAWNAAEVDRYDAGESLKFFLVTDNPEYLYAITDRSGVFLYGARKDGSVEWQKGIPEPLKKAFAEKVNKEIGKSLIDSVFANGVSVKQIPGYLLAFVDSADNFIFGAKENGSFDWQKGIPEPLRALRNIIVGASQYFLSYETDKNGGLLSTLKNDGTRTFMTPVKFEGGIKWTKKNLEELLAVASENGILCDGDWSARYSLEIPKPRCAVVNITNIANMPTTKTSDMHAIMQFWDMEGNYFMKKVIANAQGNSSMLYPKKNLSIDLCNDDWEGDDTFSLKIGDWVAQDSFHLKAYYTDYLRGRGAIGYELFNEVQKTRGLVDVEWKTALIDQNDVYPGKGQNFASIGKTDLQLDTGARNHPLAFPCIVYLNGEFYGVFAWQLKKHRDNYHMKKDTLTHVHLDGTLGAGFFGGTIDWTLFEVRNPKGLKDVDGNKYDGDNPKELSDTDPASAEVKSYIVGLSQYVSELETVKSTYGVNSPEFETAFEARFDVDNFIDYLIFSDITGNYDGFSKNWQWLTYDGVKWYIGVYDLDGIFGSEFHGERMIAPYSTHVDTTSGLPTNYIFANSNYLARLEARYAELRKSVLTYDNIVAKIQAWTDAVGIDNYKLEYDAKHWKDSPCNRDAEVDEHWELVRDTDGKPVMGNSSTYNPATTYAVDDEVYYGQNSNMGYYKFKCKSETTDNSPISYFYFKENIYSIASWVKAEIENMDALYNYSN